MIDVNQCVQQRRTIDSHYIYIFYFPRHTVREPPYYHIHTHLHTRNKFPTSDISEQFASRPQFDGFSIRRPIFAFVLRTQLVLRVATVSFPHTHAFRTHICFFYIKMFYEARVQFYIHLANFALSEIAPGDNARCSGGRVFSADSKQSTFCARFGFRLCFGHLSNPKLCFVKM